MLHSSERVANKMIPGVSLRVSLAAMKDQDQRASWGGHGLFGQYSTSLFIVKRSQDRNSNRAGNWR